MKFQLVLLLVMLVSSNSFAASLSELGSIEQLYNKLALRRSQQIAKLHEYAKRGVFPLNTNFPEQLVPYFVDDVGTACAVGHLMLLDGADSLVANIASNTNHVRIENVLDGPLLEWIRDSGLTKEECALIQPSYAKIEVYRHHKIWQDEIARLQKHFAEVEQTLLTQEQQSLRKALIAKVDAQLVEDPHDPALAIDALSEALSSSEPNVRIAAAYAIAQISNSSRSENLAVLMPNLSDSDLQVRFWTAVAVQDIGAASPRGKMELHSLTLPIFLEASHRIENEIRLLALVQLANTAPMTMGTSRQFRIMPEIRQTMVKACEDKNSKIRQFARSVLSSWRWQRVVYESKRVRQQYLAESADLESLAAETLSIGREFANQPKSIENINKHRSIYDMGGSMVYLLPNATETPLPIAESADEATQIVDDYFKSTYERYRDQTNSPWPFWEIVSAETDSQGLYYIVLARRTDSYPPTELIYILPRPAMLSRASSMPYYWFQRINSPNFDVRAGSQHFLFEPNEEADVVLGKLARNDIKAFTTSCDIFAYFLTHHSQLVIDREIRESPDSFDWSGRFAMLWNNRRFFGEGVGSSTFGSGGWDFYRFGINCNRTTGQLTFSAESIEYPQTQLPSGVLAPEWHTKELKLMGWKSLDSFDYFGDTLLPLEYQEAINAFNPDDESETRTKLYQRYIVEQSLAPPSLVLGLLYESAGKRDAAVRNMSQAAEGNWHDPNILAEVARWEFSVGLYDESRKHAEAALVLWPKQSQAIELIRRLDDK